MTTSSGADADALDIPAWVADGSAPTDGPPTGAPDEPRPPPGAGGGPGRRRRGRRILVVLGLVVGLGLTLAVLAGFWVHGHLQGTPGSEVDVQIRPGTTVSATAELLASRGVVTDAWLFRLYLRYEGVGGTVAGGEYAFHAHEAYRSAVGDLRRGPKVAVAKATIPEGFTLAQIAARIGRLPGHSAQQFLQAAANGSVRSRYLPDGTSNLEGLAFPDTYFVAPGDTDQAILQALVSEFDQLAAGLGFDATVAGRLPNGLTPYETIIVASMIEREAKVPVDRGKIARVILNRLHRGMKLQIDATVLYALGEQKTGLTGNDLRVNSPYNTYVVAGLPPGPIANPGRDSLVAALNPSPGTWLYYVLAGADGHHAFATTARDFERLVAQARAKGLL